MAIEIKSALGVVIQVLDVVDDKTSSTIDDELLKFVRAVHASDPLLDYLQEKLDSAPGEGVAFSLEQPPEPVVSEINAAAFSIGDLIKYLPIIMELLRIFRGQQNAVSDG